MKTFGLTPMDMPNSERPRTLADVLRWRAGLHGERTALIFLPDGVTADPPITIFELDQRARAVGAQLQAHGAAGRPVTLLFAPGPEFLVGFLGCVYAGAIGVPLYPPDIKRLGRTLPRFMAIVEDCQCDLILTTEALKQMASALAEHAPALAMRTWLTTDALPCDLHTAWRRPERGLEDTAFLQYTSGSTGDPKGVMVSHRALLQAFNLLAELFGCEASETNVTWLPNYHDMGLIDGWLRPVFSGACCVAMPPVAFLKRQACWLEAISKYRASVSGGPNFAYELCAERLTEADIAGLDLSSWRTAYNGAEPVRKRTLVRFIERFAAVGFRPEALAPGYGLAEATLAVSCADHRKGYASYSLSRTALEAGRVERAAPTDPEPLTTVGVGVPRIPLSIVDPETRLRCGALCVGEIWLAGETLAQGYWQRPAETEATFAACLADSREGPFLRTGDLGYLAPDGELVICGRRKDLVIIRGRNLYPQDIEQAVEQSDPANLRPGCNAAFSVDIKGEERLVIVQEIQRRHQQQSKQWENRRLPSPEVEAFAPELKAAPQLSTLPQRIRQAVNEAFGVDPHAVVLIQAGSIPKTSSGKIQRRACREAYLKGGLEVVSNAQFAPQTQNLAPHLAATTPDTAAPTAKLLAWLLSTLAERLHLPLAEVRENRPFAELGLDSKEGVALIGDLEQRLKQRLEVSLLYDHPTPARLAGFLSSEATVTPRAAVNPDSAAYPCEPMAIIGLGCRFPGAKSPAAYWRLLCEGRDEICKVPQDRWSSQALTDADPSAPGKLCSAYGGFLDGIDLFDPAAFDISPREASRIDPAQRLLLEVSAEALEDAGIVLGKGAQRSTGVFIGISGFDYGRMMLGNRSALDAYAGTGAALSIAANRISYQFDFHGPSLAVDTACSSSLVAVHLALMSLRRKECELALVGGVNLVLLPDIGVVFTKAGVLSPDGRCKAFDARANGIARAEGAGVVVLKPLLAALRDNDHIYAVIQGSAVNSDGRSNGLMAPSGEAQAAVLKAAYQDAQLEPGRVDYVEAHGTGTVLGDPIEVGAIGAVIGKERKPQTPCRIGSVKTNFGHLEAAAGIASLIKVALALHHRALPASLHFETPNPHIHFERYGVRVQTAHEPWPAGELPRVAGVSSFGFGGTNAHVVMQEAPGHAEAQAQDAPDRHWLLPLCARDAGGLRDLAEAWEQTLSQTKGTVSLQRIVHSAATRRRHDGLRLAVLGKNREELSAGLRAFAERKPSPLFVTADGAAKPQHGPVFVFCGQGGQWWAMGRQLLEREPIFAGSIERCDVLTKSMAGWSLKQRLLAPEETSRIDETEVTQPALFALQLALVELWHAWGIEPAAVVGHSMGELTAACVAGKLTLEDAFGLVLERGRLMQSTRGNGAMAAVELTRSEAQALVLPYKEKLSVAVNNAPRSCVLAGDPAALAQAVAELEGRGVLCRALQVDVAGHSPAMEPLRAKLMEAAQGLRPRPCQVPFYSSVIGERGDALVLDGTYFGRNLCEPVLFHQTVERLLQAGYTTFLEISAHPVLSAAIIETAKSLGSPATALPSLRRKVDEHETMLATAAALYCQGLPLNLPGIYPAPERAVPLPTTPFSRQRYWLESPRENLDEHLGSCEHPLLGKQSNTPLHHGQESFELDLDLERLPLVGDHRVQDLAVFPATAYLELVSVCAKKLWSAASVELTECRFHRALVLSREPRRVHTVFTMASGQERRATFQVFSAPRRQGEAVWTLHASGTVESADSGSLPPSLDLAALRRRCTLLVSAEQHYRAFADRGIEYRGAFQSVREVWRGKGEAQGLIELGSTWDKEASRFAVHPALLDACLQVIAEVLPAEIDRAAPLLPIGCERISLLPPPRGRAVCHVTLKPSTSSQAAIADVVLADEQGTSWGELQGFAVARLEASGLDQELARDWLYQVEWEKAATAAPRFVARNVRSASSWLIFEDKRGLGAKVGALLTGRGEKVVYVRPEAEPAPSAAGQFAMAPCSKEQLTSILSTVGEELSGVLYLCALDHDGADASALEHQAQLELLGPVLHLVQAFGHSPVAKQPKIWLVTNRSERVASSDGPPNVRGAPLWGLGRCLAHEHPELLGGLIDLDAETDAEELLAQLDAVREEDRIGLRSGQRFVPRLVRRVTQAETRPLACNPQGLYLITGGLGGLGLQLASWLVGRGARHLLLTCRSAFAPRVEWEGLASCGNLCAASLLALEKQGAKVCVAAADVADLAAMKLALQQQSPSPLRGIIHAAGVVRPRPLLEATLHDFGEELRPKIAGALVLEELAREHALDFFILFSSASAIWGSRLLAGYGAANHFLDALAERRHSQGQPALSVNFAMWSDAGMAKEATQASALVGMGLRPMAPLRVLLLLESLLAENACRATIADVDWSVLRPLFEQQPQRRLLRRLEAAPKGEPGLSSAHKLDTERSEWLDELVKRPLREDRRRWLAERIREAVATVLGKQPAQIEPGKSLLALGLDSLSAVDLRGRLESALPIKLNLLSLLKGDSVQELVDRLLESHLGTAIAEVSPAPGPHQERLPRCPEEETLPERIRAVSSTFSEPGPPRTVLLTGATGFLGTSVLHELLESTSATVHCLARAGSDAAATLRVRAELERTGRWRAEFEGRVRGLAGDLPLPRVGLEAERFEELGQTLDAIFHVGYLVNFLFGYEDLRPTNVGGTLSLLELAVTGRAKPVHFVSSFSVLLTSEYAGRTVGDEEVLYPAQGGYRETKRACELLIGEGRRRGLKVGIFRPPFIGWHSQSGHYNERDFLIRLIKGCLALGAAPALDTVFFIAPVDFVSRALVQLALHKHAATQTYNLLSAPRGITWQRLVELFNAAGCALPILPFEAWRERLLRAGAGNPLEIFFPTFGRAKAGRGLDVLELFERGNVPEYVDLSQLRAHAELAASERVVDEEYVKALLARLRF